MIHAFQRGETPEGIVQSHAEPARRLCGGRYYLANPAAIDEYLRHCDVKADALRRKIESSQPPREDLRQLIMARAGRTVCFVIELVSDENVGQAYREALMAGRFGNEAD